MKALSVRQPWASYIAGGLKTVECRTWRVNYRGSLLICASKGDDEVEFDDGTTVIVPGGMALAVVELVDVRKMTKDDLEDAWIPEEWYEDALRGYAWHLKLVHAIKPFPVKGKLNLFEVDALVEPLLEPYTNGHFEYLLFTQGKTLSERP